MMHHQKPLANQMPVNYRYMLLSVVDVWLLKRPMPNRDMFEPVR